VLLADFALTQAAYILVLLLLNFPTLNLPEGEKFELVGAEKQRTTLVLSIKEGCKVEVGSGRCTERALL
jgi:hypothetical protein